MAYIEDAFGPLAGFLAWVVLIILYEPAADAAIAVVVIDSLVGLVPALGGPATRVALLLLMFGGLVAVNVRGFARASACRWPRPWPSWCRWCCSPWSARSPSAGPISPGTECPPIGDFGTAALTLFFAFGGIETALTPSGEVRDPARTVPRGVFGAVVAVVVLYLALQVVSQGVLGATLATQTEAPLAATAGLVMGGVGRSMVLAGATIAGFGAIAADYVCSPRAFIPIAERGLLPRSLASIHPRFHTPWVAIIVYGVIGFTLAVSGGFAALAVLAGMALLLIYLGVCLAALRMRYTRPAVRGTFRAPGGPAAAVLGSATVVWLLTHSGWQAAVAVGGVMALAVLYYALNARLGRLQPAPVGVDSEIA